MLLHDGAFFREFIPGANFQTDVAPVNAVPNGGAELFWDGAFQFDREIGNAAAGIELERRGNGVGGAGINAAGASAAAVWFRVAGRKFEGGDDLGDEKPVSQRAADEVGVLAGEAEAGALS